MPRRRGLRPRLLAAVIRSKATLAFAAERQVVIHTWTSWLPGSKPPWRGTTAATSTFFPETDKVLVTIWGIEAEVNNGGFDQFYFNSAGDHAFFAPQALTAIGARSMAEIASRANAVFGLGGPPRSRDERQSKVEQIAANGSEPWDGLDREFQAYPDNIRNLLGEFLNVKRAG